MPIPPTEGERLRVLRSLEILDTADDHRLDGLTALAAQICGTPIGKLSLVDKDRQWFKSSVGCEVRETPRDVSICQHTIMGTDPLVIEDTWEDPRTSESPLVQGPEGTRFYAGAPIVVMGEAIGVLCALDTRPRTLSKTQIAGLEVLASLAASLLKLDYHVREQEARIAELHQERAA